MRPQRSKTGRGGSSRDRILAAAVDLIAARGYAGTSVGDVCRRAGVAKTALYWHFGSKEGLLEAVIESVGVRWIEEILKSVYQEGDPLQRLDRLVEAWRSILLEQPHLLRLLLLVLLERSAGSDSTRDVLLRVWQRAEAAISRGLLDSTPVPIAEVELLAHNMLALMVAALVRLLLDPTGTDLDRLFLEFKRAVVLAVEARLPKELRGASRRYFPREKPPPTP